MLSLNYIKLSPLIFKFFFFVYFLYKEYINSLVTKHSMNKLVHRCGPGYSMRACHAADPVSIPARDKFPGWGFFRVFFWPIRRISGSFRPGIFNLLSSRANLHLSYDPAGRSYCRLQSHHGYIKHHHRGMCGSPGNVGEVSMT